MELKTVLVVDDQPWVIKTIQLHLRPVRVVGTTKAVEALVLARQERPQLALVDLYMPDGWGLDVVKQLRGEFPTLVIGVMSAALTIELGMESIRASATWFIEKPFDKVKLRKAIEQGGAPLRVPREEEAVDLSLEVAKSKHVDKVVAMSGGNISAAARQLKIARPSLQRMLKRRS